MHSISTAQTEKVSPAAAAKEGSPAGKHYLEMWLGWLLLVGFAASFAIAVYRLPLSAFVQDLNYDDSFYYYSIARNLANGVFSTADGIHRTNGYHPLWALLLSPVFALVKDPVMALRVAKVEEITMLGLSAVFMMLAGLELRWKPAWMLAAGLFLFRDVIFFRGLEVAVQVLLLTVMMFLLARLFRTPRNRVLWVAVPACCFLLPWARLEAFATAVIAALLVSLKFMPEGREYRGRVAGLWAGTVSSVAIYFGYNRLAFGTLVPVSGQIKAYWSGIRFAETGGYHLAINGVAFLKRERHLEAAALFCLLLIVVSWAVPAYRSKEYGANHGLDVFLLALIGGFGARLAYSIGFLYIDYDVPWYYVPGMLLYALAIPFAINRAFLLLSLRRGPLPRTMFSMGMNRVGSLGSLAAISVLLVMAIVMNPFRQISKFRSGWRPGWQSASLEGTEWMNRNLPRGAVIGSSDSGIIGYFSEHRVVNLDGVVNSAQFLNAVRNQEVEDWIQHERIDYLANPIFTNISGCEFMAISSGQNRTYTNRCGLIYQGSAIWPDRWSGKLRYMRFQVLGASTPVKAGDQ